MTISANDNTNRKLFIRYSLPYFRLRYENKSDANEKKNLAIQSSSLQFPCSPKAMSFREMEGKNIVRRCLVRTDLLTLSTPSGWKAIDSDTKRTNNGYKIIHV